MKSTRVEEGLQPEPMFRYHCLACSEVTLAPRGQATVACKRCGVEVGDASRTLDEIRANMERLQEMLQVRQGFDEYARADAEVTVHMVRMSDELALATLYLKVTDPKTSDSKGS
jgi:hypothetical protein